MRELKFRAWHETDKCWYNPRFIEMNLLGQAMLRGAEGLFEIVPASAVEQYTGLKDKNGKEIYEGDILWWEHFYGMTGENIETTAKVYWEEKDASFVVGDWFEPLGHLVDEDEVEVIGNIHENPELL